MQKTSPELEKALSVLIDKIQRVYPGLRNARWVALRLLEGDSRIIEAFENGEIDELLSAQQLAPEHAFATEGGGE